MATSMPGKKMLRRKPKTRRAMPQRSHNDMRHAEPRQQKFPRRMYIRRGPFLVLRQDDFATCGRG